MVRTERAVTSTGRRFGVRLRALIDGLGVSAGGRAVSVDGLYRMFKDRPDLSMSRGHLYRLVEGTAIPRLDLIEALAEFFDVPPSYFVGGDSYLDEIVNKIDSAVEAIDVMVNSLTELRIAVLRSKDATVNDRPVSAVKD